MRTSDWGEVLCSLPRCRQNVVSWLWKITELYTSRCWARDLTAREKRWIFNYDAAKPDNRRFDYPK